MAKKGRPTLDEVKRATILERVRECGSIAEAAETLDVHRDTIVKYLAAAGVRIDREPKLVGL